MTDETTPRFDHRFGQHIRQDGEDRTLKVVLMTALCMVLEIVAGLWTGSMGLLGDGIHMGTHVLAIGITLLAYRFGRSLAGDPRFSFGTGKINALAAFASAIILAMSAVLIVIEAADRLMNPRPIAFAEAIRVASLGLIVNLASAYLLHGGAGHGEHHHGAHHHHDHGAHNHHGHDHAHHHHHDHDHEDIGLRAAFLHVLADALTSVGAILALVIGWNYGAVWLDPLVALIASVVIMLWAVGLLRESAKVLLDWQASPEVLDSVRSRFEQDGESRVVDLHIWRVAPGVRTLVASVVTTGPRSPDDYIARLPSALNIEHPIVEVRVAPAGRAAEP